MDTKSSRRSTRGESLISGHTSQCIEHNEGHITLERLLQKKGHYSDSFDEFRERHPERAALSFSTLRRVSLFARQPSRLLEHPLLATGVAVVGIGEVAVMHGWLPGLGGRSQERPYLLDRIRRLHPIARLRLIHLRLALGNRYP